MTIPINIKYTLSKQYDDNFPGEWGYRYSFQCADETISPFASGAAAPWFRLGADDAPDYYLTLGDALNDVWEAKGDIIVASVNNFYGFNATVFHRGDLITVVESVNTRFRAVESVADGATEWIDAVTSFAEEMLAAEDSGELATVMDLQTSHIGGLATALADMVTDIGDLQADMLSMPTTFDDLSDGATNKAFTATLKTKLDGVASAATANDTDANLKARANHTGTQTASTISDFSTAADTRADARISNARGAVSGIAPLGSDSKIASTYLPSYVDDVIEAVNFGALPGTGETGKIYVTTNDNKCFRWSGSAYVEISPSPGSTDSVTEGSANLYFTVARVLASVLTGLSTASATVISASDTVLSALGNLQAQITANKTRTTSAWSPSLVGTGATGAQISTTKDSTVRASVSTSTTSTIGGPSTSAVALKICATNSSTEGDWTTVATFQSDQTITLAVVLQSVQVVKGQLTADVPAGWFVKLVNSGSGTHSESFLTGQKTLYA